MPNHLTTVCTVTGDASEISAFRELAIRPTASGDGFFFDLGAVIPRPDCVSDTESGKESDTGFFALTGLVHVRFFMFGARPPLPHGFTPGPFDGPETLAGWLEKNKPKVLEKGRRSLRCFRETGYRDWYDWSYANWGTKWNSYDYRERESTPDRFVFQFDTANGMPEPVFSKLVENFPGLRFDCVTIDEGGPEYEGAFFIEGPNEMKRVEHNLERYRIVYGRDPDTEEDDENES